jgi:hypothetical protein
MVLNRSGSEISGVVQRLRALGLRTGGTAEKPRLDATNQPDENERRRYRAEYFRMVKEVTNSVPNDNLLPVNLTDRDQDKLVTG